jgi:hypothetical protein
MEGWDFVIAGAVGLFVAALLVQWLSGRPASRPSLAGRAAQLPGPHGPDRRLRRAGRDGVTGRRPLLDPNVQGQSIVGFRPEPVRQHSSLQRDRPAYH